VARARDIHEVARIESREIVLECLDDEPHTLLGLDESLRDDADGCSPLTNLGDSEQAPGDREDMERRCGEDHELLGSGNGEEVCARSQAIGEPDSRKIAGVHVRGVDLVGDVGLERPELDRIAVLGENLPERRAPGSRADDSD
jgi:hypothetical protein